MPNQKRAEPGTRGEGDYYRIEVADSEKFETFRYHDVGDPGYIQRLAGRKANGEWEDQAWIIDKKMAKVEDGKLIATDPEAKELLDEIGEVEHVKGDVFRKVSR